MSEGLAKRLIQDYENLLKELKGKKNADLRTV